MTAISKEMFDAAFVPGFRQALQATYADLREMERQAFDATLDDSGHFAPGAAYERDCPLCARPADDAALLHFVHGMHVVTCARCGLSYSREVLSAEQDQRRYLSSGVPAQTLKLRRQALYAQLERTKAAYVMQRVGEHAPLAGRMLDIGCSNGQLLQAAAAQGWSVCGIEANDSLVAECRQQGLAVLAGFFPAVLPLQSGFALISMLDVLEHVVDPLHFLKTVGAQLRDGGLLVVQVPNLRSLLIQLEGAKNSNFCHGHWSYFTPQTLTQLLETAGFTPVFSETIISELDRILAFPPAQVAATVKALTGESIAPESLDADWLHRHGLGYKVLSIVRKVAQR